MSYFICNRKFADSFGNRLSESELPKIYFGSDVRLEFNLSGLSPSIRKLSMVCDIDRDIGNGLCFKSETIADSESLFASFQIDTKTDKFFSAVNGMSGFIKAYVQIHGYDDAGNLVDVILDDFCMLSSIIGNKDEIIVPFDYSKLESKIAEYADDAYAASVVANDSAEEAKRSEMSCKIIQASLEKKLKENVK